jgi:hypothetical protein
MILRSLVILVGTFSAASVMAADLPKEGTFKGTYTAVGTYKLIKIGDRSLTNVDEMGLQITNGIADRMTFHCWGTEETNNGETAGAGYCVAMDPTGDLIEGKLAKDRHPRGENFKGTLSFVAGTGKFNGISGTCVNDYVGVKHFRAVVEGTYIQYVTSYCDYKLP